MQTFTTDQLIEARGTPVYASDGEKIGSVEEIFVDEQTGRPEWIGLGTGFLGTKRVLVPVEGASLREGGVLVPYSKDQVKDTPDIDSGDIGRETEAMLYSHYGLSYSDRQSETGLPESGRGDAATGEQLDTGLAAGGPSPDSPGDDAEGEPVLTRSEEELNIGTRDVVSGRARLRKWVETDPVQADVELTRERVRVTREPVDQPVSGVEIGEEAVEVPLHAEQPVLQKQTVAKERISLEKDVETERATISDELRKERVEIEDEAEPAR
jgi:uncharacterized protein (TIGR02271 family)